MGIYNNNNFSIIKLFLYSAIAILVFGLVFGVLGTFQYYITGFTQSYFSFEKTRPLHVTSVLFWILLSSIGGNLSYLQEYTQQSIRFPLLLKTQWFLFILTIIVILASYILGFFGGREYWEFNPLLAIPIILAWILFGINFFTTLKWYQNQPVYVWMWATGIIFFLFTYLESYLWLFPYFRNNIINDMTIQWKSYGSMVGAWNMLIYGSGIFLLEKISNQKTYGKSTIAFVLFFTSLTNLMFNWGHHIYTLPTHQYIKIISYIISMSELYIFGRIIYKWNETLSEANKFRHNLAYRFLLASEIWIFLSLGLAILISIPGINIFTHGTHITVAHAMGTTIGINSFILFAIIIDILDIKIAINKNSTKWMIRGFWLINVNLFFFWSTLIALGIYKANWQMYDHRPPYNMLMTNSIPLFILLSIFGCLLFVGFVIFLSTFIWTLFNKNTTVNNDLI